MKHVLWIIGLLLAACGVAACGVAPVPTLVAQSPTLTAAPTGTPDFAGRNGPAVTQTFTPAPSSTPAPTVTPTLTASPTATPTLYPLSIAAMRQRSYPGSAVTLESTLAPGANYQRYIASYQSEGLKIYGLLTVPNGAPPASGWPVIIFNHGFIPPAQYRTTSLYVAYQDGLARSGYIVFKSDYRGHGSSQGAAGGAYGSPDYVVDVLNALASLEHYPGADANRVGMWGHSMGGYITLRAMVISHDIKAGVIWSGVVGSYPDLLNNWHRRPPANPNATPEPGLARGWRSLVQLFGPPETNPDFWNSISATSFLGDLSGPLQLHHDTADSEVPFQFSQTLYQDATAAGQTAELYSYPGDDHNLTNSFNQAMARTIAFFDQYVKGNSTTGQ
jgi:dipeptidyl aminopeptidase/acylaminoacyl peptidase